MTLSPELVDAPEKTLVALSRNFTLDTRAEIPPMWVDFWGRGWQFEGDEEMAAFGASFNAQPDGAFTYAIGRHITPTPDNLPEGACTVTLSGGRYAVFRNQGPVSELPGYFDAIFSDWLPGSGESQREGAVFERYPYSDDASPDNMVYEIWVPIA
ncbi:MAG: GyrI-like domain-containing protein [Pseudomonadota bacterium]